MPHVARFKAPTSLARPKCLQSYILFLRQTQGNQFPQLFPDANLEQANNMTKLVTLTAKSGQFDPTEIRWGSVGLLPARIASSLAYQPDISDTSTGAALSLYESVDSSPGLCCLLLSHIDSHPHLDALRFVRKLFPAQAAETRCEASDKNLISSQAWSLWIFMQHTYSQIM